MMNNVKNETVVNVEHHKHLSQISKIPNTKLT